MTSGINSQLHLYDELERVFSQVGARIPFAGRVSPKTLETWRKLDIVPPGAMLEVMELMQRIHAGMGQDYVNVLPSAVCCMCRRRPNANAHLQVLSQPAADPRPDR